MLGTIAINKLRTKCILGLNPQERIEEQVVEISVSVTLDFSEVEGSLDTSKTIDWFILANELEVILKERKFHLGEDAVVTLAKHILTKPKAISTTVTLSKFEISSRGESVSASITISRSPGE